MPKETVYGTDGTDVTVTWGTEAQEIVQVVTTGETQRLINIVNEWLTDAGMPAIDHAELARRTPLPERFGWWVTLNGWTGANRLIKVLQRARNRSFGDPA